MFYSKYIVQKGEFIQDKFGLLAIDGETRKELYLIPTPYDLLDVRKRDVVFETNNEIKYFSVSMEKGKNEIVICEELMYV